MAYAMYIEQNAYLIEIYGLVPILVNITFHYTSTV